MARDPLGYYDQARTTFLQDGKKFKEDLLTYDRDNIPDELIERARELMKDPLLTQAAIANATKALVPVRTWAAAMILYHDTLKIVNPLRA